MYIVHTRRWHAEYSSVCNTSHTVLGDMPNFYQKLVCITRHAIQFYQRPGWNTEHTNSLLMWQWHHFCFEVTREGLRPGWNCRHGKLFTQRPGWNKRILRKIQCVLIKSPVTCIQDERVLPTPPVWQQVLDFLIKMYWWLLSHYQFNWHAYYIKIKISLHFLLLSFLRAFFATSLKYLKNMWRIWEYVKVW